MARLARGKRDYAFIRKHCAEQARRLFDDFDLKRKSILTDVAREFHPLGVAGLVKSVEELSDESPYDEDHRLLTTKPVDCLRKGAAGFHGNLTSPARRWFRLRMPSFATEDGKTDSRTRAALDRLTDAVEWAFSRGNLYPSLYKVYEHCLCYGFACMLVTQDSERIVKARTLRIGTYAMGIGEDGQVCRVVRRFSWTAEQILAEFGDAGVPDNIRNAAKKADKKRRWTVYNLIEPNAVGDLKAYDRVAQALDLDDSMVYRSVYWLECGKDDDAQSGILEISGFTIKPIVAPRLEYELGDTYGRGRGMDGLDIARGVQSFQYDILKISGNRAQPAVVASSEFKDEGLKLGRGEVNYARFGESRNALVMPALAQPPDSKETRVDRQDAENELADLFFNTAFATIDALKNNSGVKTATEVDALVRENMERLNPVVTNFDKELLDPLVSIVTKYTLQAGICPLTPDDLMMMGTVNIEYVSQIHLAAKQSQIGAIDAWVAKVGQVAAAKPAILDNIDEDGLSGKYAELLGVPEVCVTSEDKVALVRQARQQTEAQAAQAAQMEALGNAAKIGSVPTDDQHLGGLITKGMGGE
jgi:hypothetical protein